MHKIYFVLPLLLQLMIKEGKADPSLTNTIHRTQAATERVNDVWCYECDTMDSGDACVDVLNNNISTFVKKCQGKEFTCMVKRFSYTTSTENSTSSPKMWSLDRRCTENCEAGCIVIGERTKLYACTSCCEESLCNTGRGAASSILNRRVETGIGTVFAVIAFIIFNSYKLTYRVADFCY